MKDRFTTILDELGELHNRKSADYGSVADPYANVRGSEAWGIPGWLGAMLRANDKVKRLQAFAVNGRLANEGVEDAFRDLAVYAIIGLVLYEESLQDTPAQRAKDQYDLKLAKYLSGCGDPPSGSDSPNGLPDATGWPGDLERVSGVRQGPERVVQRTAAGKI